MTNINFPSSGGSSILNYAISECSGSAVLTFEPSDNWYTVNHDTLAHTITIATPSTSSSSYRSSDIVVKLNGSGCTSQRIVVRQDGLGPCDCNSLTNIDISLYEIPASGVSSGTVIGTYTLLGSNCDETEINFYVTITSPGYFGGHFDLVAENGELILVSDVIDNPYEDIIEYDVDIYYDDDKCRSFSVVQDGTEVTCDCDYAEMLLRKQYQYFSNHPYNSASTSGKSCTYLTNVLIASGSTACGNFSVHDVSNGILSAWTESDESHIYIYADIEEFNGDSGRSLSMDILYQTKKGEDCRFFPIELYQSPTQYFRCGSTACTPSAYISYTNNYHANGKYINASTYDYVQGHTFYSGVTMLRTIYYEKYVKIKPRIEVGYCDLIVNNTYFDTENEEPIIGQDPASIVDFSYTLVSSGLIEASIQFKDINLNENKSKYAKIYLDVYTDNGNVYCCTPGSLYEIQAPYQCCDCNLIETVGTSVEVDGGEHTYTYGRWSSTKAKMPCSYGAYLDSVEISPSSAGTVIVTSRYPDGSISGYTYQFYENNDERRFITVYENIKCSGDASSEGCSYIVRKGYQAANTCNCSGMTSAARKSEEIMSEPISTCGEGRRYEEVVSYTASTCGFNVSLLKSVPSTFCTKADAYVVICDVSGTPVDMSTYMSSDGYIMGECPMNTNGFKPRNTFYETKGGYKLWASSYSDWNTQIKLENPSSADTCYNYYYCYPSFYYYLAFYDKTTDELICTSKDVNEMYVFNNKLSFVVKMPKEDCECEFDCNTFSGFSYTLNSELATCSISNYEYVLVSSGGGEFIVATFNHYNGEDLTNFGICSGMGEFVCSVNSTMQGIVCEIINDNQFKITIPSYTEQNQRTFTCNVYYGYKDNEDNTHICEKYFTINFLQCGNEYENCSCSNES